ncbi:hypothetical protein ACLOJK_030139 [Asimina triloba]
MGHQVDQVLWSALVVRKLLKVVVASRDVAQVKSSEARKVLGQTEALKPLKGELEWTHAELRLGAYEKSFLWAEAITGDGIAANEERRKLHNCLQALRTAFDKLNVAQSKAIPMKKKARKLEVALREQQRATRDIFPLGFEAEALTLR